MIGAIGPTLLLLVMALSGWQVVRTAIRETNSALSHRALESSSFAARFVAETAAHEIERRWDALEEAAMDPQLRGLLTEVALGAAAENHAAAYQPQFQRWLDRASADLKSLGGTSFFLTDAAGLQWARTPRSDTILRNWAYRDYFHGKGYDYRPGQGGADIKPITEPHLSTVFQSRASSNRVVAFSVPVLVPERDDKPRQVLGVLGMTVEMGRFGELHPGSGNGARQIAVLVDTRKDWKGQRGLILQHPMLLQKLQHPPLPDYRIDAELLQRLESFYTPRRQSGAASAPLFVDEQYEDPVGKDPAASEYGGRFLAAMELVKARGKDTGWVVVVQERETDLVAPVVQLERRLSRIGGLGVALAVVLLTLLWGLVLFELSASSRKRTREARAAGARNPALDETMEA
jgi:hypothetical protein